MSNQLYRCFSTGTTRRKLLPADDSFIAKTQELIDKSPSKDFYESIYLYNKDHYEQFQKTGSLAGLKDGVKTDRIVFDFDSKADPSLAQNDAKVVVQRLKEKFDNNAIRIAYSGGKGMHVEVHLNSFIDRTQFENIVEAIAGDLPTFDHKIKDEQRLFRFPLTLHNSSGRYKIPLTAHQLNSMSIEQIEAKSKTQDHTPFHNLLNTYETADIPEDYKMFKKITKVEIKTVATNQTDRPDMSRKPKHLTAAKYALQEGYFEEGERNEACMILATTYKYLGYNVETTYNIIKATLRLRARRKGLGEVSDNDKQELWRTVITPVYSPLWKGGTYNEEDGLLKLTIERYDLDKVDISEAGLVALTSLADNFKDFAVNIKKNTIKLGIDEIDSKARVTTSMFVCLLAAPGAGKTSISMGILNALNKNNEKAIFFSLDMGVPQVYQRLIQRHTGHKSDKITENYELNNKHAIEEYDRVLGQEYNNIKFCFKGGLNCEQIKQIILAEKDFSGSLPKLVIIDYLECVQSPFSDSTQSKAYIATALKNIANELGICVFLLVQPTKQGGDPSNELNSYSQIKGSGVLAEASTIVFTLSRPGFSPKNPDDDHYATINVVKNRLGELSSTDLHWDGLTGNIRSLSGEEENDLKALRAEIAAEKNNKKDDDIY